MHLSPFRPLSTLSSPGSRQQQAFPGWRNRSRHSKVSRSGLKDCRAQQLARVSISTRFGCSRPRCGPEQRSPRSQHVARESGIRKPSAAKPSRSLNSHTQLRTCFVRAASPQEEWTGASRRRTKEREVGQKRGLRGVSRIARPMTPTRNLSLPAPLLPIFLPAPTSCQPY